MSEEKWAFTFRYGSKNRKKYVIFEGSYHEARKSMEERFGMKWAFQYDWEKFQKQIEDYGLTELKEEEDLIEDIPFLVVGNDELGDLIPEEIVCPHCEKLHPIEYGTQEVNGKQVPSKLLAFYKCGEKLYLAGIKGRLLK